MLNDPGLSSLKGALSGRRAALLVQKSGLKPDHPGAVAAEREMAEIDVELMTQSAHLENGVRGNLLARLQGKADQAGTVERGLQEKLTLLASRSLAGQRSSRSDIIGPSWLDRRPGVVLAA